MAFSGIFSTWTNTFWPRIIFFLKIWSYSMTFSIFDHFFLGGGWHMNICGRRLLRPELSLVLVFHCSHFLENSLKSKSANNDTYSPYMDFIICIIFYYYYTNLLSYYYYFWKFINKWWNAANLKLALWAMGKIEKRA